jgi:hypothetical protein
MKRFMLLLPVLLAVSAGTAVFAQDPKITGDQDGSSQQVEESDEAYRRRMELQDARYRDPSYTDPVGSWAPKQEKIDKLPPESRDNIRDQLVDVIMANPDWKPGDALEEYPYEPTATAQADTDLLEREQAAWDEQIEKYHAREAEAFGAYRGAVSGPGNPSGQEGGDGGQAGQQGNAAGQQGGGEQGGQQGEDAQAESTAGTYQPQNGGEGEEPGKKGVSQSALDFLLGRQQGQDSSRQAQRPGDMSERPESTDGQAADGSPPSFADSSQPPGDPSPRSAPSEQDPQSQADQREENETDPTEPDMRGIIAIEDLEKLEGTGNGTGRAAPPEDEEPDDLDDSTGSS